MFAVCTGLARTGNHFTISTLYCNFLCFYIENSNELLHCDILFFSFIVISCILGAIFKVSESVTFFSEKD